MQRVRHIVMAAAFATAAAFTAAPASAQGSYGHRQYYGSWSYSSSHSYYFTTYYYRPVTTVTTYSHHYCVYYPSRPRYVYYYNPSSQVYWGRYDLEKKGYSMLAKEDRKRKLEDIDEAAFPEPGEMPPVPDAKDDAQVLAVSTDSLPKLAGPKTAATKR